MPSITDLLLDRLPNISAEYSVNIGEPSKHLESVRERILEKNSAFQILPFTAGNDLPTKRMIAADGGRATQKLAGGDLVVVGATVGEAARGNRMFTTEESIPAEAYAAVVPHTSQNQKVEELMMAALELRVLQKTPADVKIIDGAYLGNVNTVLFGLISGSDLAVETILDIANGDEDRCLREALNTILMPAREPEVNLVAVAKSDSSFIYNNRLAEAGIYAGQQLSDRILASRILEPGELFQPRPLIAPRPLINAYKKIKTDDHLRKDFGEGFERRELLREIVAGKDSLLRKLDSSTNSETESLIWTTYFKPSAWSKFAPAIKIEFTHYVTETRPVVERARQLISYLDQDIITEEFLEPWCQYEADRRAKDVSVATDIVRNHLISSTTSAHEALGLLRGYRS